LTVTATGAGPAAGEAAPERSSFRIAFTQTIIMALSDSMSTRDYSASLARLRELLDRGPFPASGDTLKARIRRGIRSAVLRALRPYTYYQQEVDSILVSCLGAYEHDTHRIEMLEAMAEDLIAAVESLRRRTASFDLIGPELRAVPYLAGNPFERFQSDVGEVTGYRTLNGSHGDTSPYTAFEDLFRGPSERVSELQRPYLDLVAEHQPVLDVGCGRGEFLALLASEGIAVSGVDSDPGMVARCHARGLSAELGDATDYLEGRDDGTLGTIFCAQVIEHLPVDQLRRLLDISRRKLKPGGLFIAETVNPHSVAALKTFWVDLTHKHPIFPEVALALCAIAGFSPAYVFAPGYDGFEDSKFDSTSYAVVAAAPAQARN
jgi:SAM-dependent methyltransferase